MANDDSSMGSDQDVGLETGAGTVSEATGQGVLRMPHSCATFCAKSTRHLKMLEGAARAVAVLTIAGTVKVRMSVTQTTLGGRTLKVHVDAFSAVQDERQDISNDRDISHLEQQATEALEIVCRLTDQRPVHMASEVGIHFHP